ncbi:hypothetical protein AB0M54_39835 [Actinoplanes sp. NPDC051470]|uniref:hypothetical protein n=1 Tax=unclassified Actinoplanes TaxID=2626549 RepID=UPI00341DC2A0
MNATDADLAAAGQAITALAADVAARLAELRAALEPTRAVWCGGGVDLEPMDEWTIAVDGLLGPDGVLGQISRATATTWPAFPGAGWDGGDPAPVRD